jgi:hypothetical protein
VLDQTRGVGVGVERDVQSHHKLCKTRQILLLCSVRETTSTPHETRLATGSLQLTYTCLE